MSQASHDGAEKSRLATRKLTVESAFAGSATSATCWDWQRCRQLAPDGLCVMLRASQRWPTASLKGTHKSHEENIQ